MKFFYLVFSLFVLFVSFSSPLFAQNGVSINTSGTAPDASAILDLSAQADRGFILPKVALTGVNAAAPLTLPATGILVWNTATIGPLTPGLYYNSGTAAAPVWTRLATGTSTVDWSLDGNTNGAIKYIGTNDNFDFPFSTNGTERMRITSAGNFGIGTTIPAAKLEINGTTLFSGVATIASGQRIQVAANGGARIIGAQGDTPVTPAIGFFSTNGVDDGGGGNGIYRPIANTMAFATVSAERMRITSTGNVGIGTVAPDASAILDLTSSSRGLLIPRVALTATNLAGPVAAPATSLMVYNTATAGVAPNNVTPGYYYWDGAAWLRFNAGNGLGDWALDGNTNGIIRGIGTNDNFDFPIETNGTEKMRVTTGGFVGIGVVTPQARLDVIGSNASTNSLLLRSGNDNNAFLSNQILFGYNGTNTYQHAIKTRHNSINTIGNAYDFYLWSQGVDVAGTIGTRAVMTIDGNYRGMVGIGTTTPKSELHITDGSASLKAVTDAGGYGASVLITDNVIPRIYFESAGLPANKKLMGITSLNQVLSIGSLNDVGSAWDQQFILSAHRDGFVGVNMGNPIYNLEVNGTFGFGNGTAGVYRSRTETRNDAGLQASQSGMFETQFPAPAADWPVGANSWWHLLDVRHSNNTNNYAMQFSGSFFDQDLYFRKTNGAANTAWNKVLTTANFNTLSWSLLGNSGTNAATNFIGTTDATDFVMRTSNTEKIRVTAAGNVGIGTGISNPNAKLQIDGNISMDNVAAVVAPNRIIGFPTPTIGNHGTLQIQAKSNVFSGTLYLGGNLLMAAGDYNLSGSAGGDLGGIATIRAGKNTFDGSGGGDITFEAGGAAYTERMRIKGVSGNVGIGTNAPAARLTIAGVGNIFAVDNQASFMARNAVAAYEAYFWPRWSDNIMYMNYGSAGFHIRNNASATTMFMTNTNFVGIGVTAPAVRLAVAGNGVNVYATDVWTENNIHVQGNEALLAGGRGRLRVGSAWQYQGLYTDLTSSGAANDLVLGASSTWVRIGPGGGTVQNLYAGQGNIIALNNSTSTTPIQGWNQNGTGTGVWGVGNGFGSAFALAAGSGGSFTGTQYGVVGASTSATGGIVRSGGFFRTNGAGSFAFVACITAANVVRKIEGNGTVNTTVRDLNEKLVVLSAPEAPENLFEDYGKGQLVNGFTHIEIDPIFTKNIMVNEQHDLRVFIQLEGDCNGVFVSNKSGNGFDVKELANGNSNTKFTYHIVANRADEVLPDGTISRYSMERFAPAIGPQNGVFFEIPKELSKNR